MRWICLFCLFYNSFELFAQNSSIKNREFSFTLGSSGTFIQSFPTTGRIDFLNYVERYDGPLDNLTVRLGYKFDFLAQMSADFKLMLMSDLFPDSYDISAYYHVNDELAFGVGSMLYANYISDYGRFHEELFPTHFLIKGDNNQFKSYDLGLYITPVHKRTINERLSMTFKCDLGLSTFLNGRFEYLHKKEFSNERISYQYKTRLAPQPFINPKIEVRLQALTISSTSIGLLFNSNLYFAKRRMEYALTESFWSAENASKIIYKGRFHNYSRFEAYLGLYLGL